MLRKKQYPVYFILPGIFLFVMFFIVPFLVGFRYSFTNWNFKRADFIGLENYISILKNPNMSIAFKNTFLFTIVTTVGKVSIGMLLAVLLNRKLKTTNYLRTVFYLPAVVNSIAVGIVFTSLMHPSKGLINTALRTIGFTGFQPKWLTDTSIAMLSICFIEIWKWSGYTMMILLAGMQNISKDYYEAIDLDGGGPWAKFRYITWPMLSNVTFFQLINGIIAGFATFTQSYMVAAIEPKGNGTLGGVKNSLLFYAVNIYNESFRYLKFGYASAMAVIMLIGMIVITLILFKTSKKWVYYGGGGRDNE